MAEEAATTKQNQRPSPDAIAMEGGVGEVKLLGAWPSSYAYRVIWALKLKGIQYEYMEEDLTHKSYALLQYNPVHKKIPVLIHGGKPICESTVILEYIEDAWPQNPLLPQDPCERATARFWTKFAEDKDPTFFRYFQKTGEEQQKATEEARQVLAAIEEYCSGLGEGKKFFGGVRIGFTDLMFGWIAWWLEAMEEAVGVKLMVEGSFPFLNGWKQRFREDAIIRDNLPDRDELVRYFKRLRERFIASAMT